MDFDPSRVLFMGIGSSPVCYYRIMLPAMAMGADWVGVSRKPPDFFIDTGIVKGETRKPKLLSGEYDIVVVQQPYGDGWLELIKRMQDKGIKVVFEIDDYLHAIRHLDDHTSASKYNRQLLNEMEEAMGLCDAMIVSTDWLKIKYKRFNENAFVCQNGIDLRRYELELPEHMTVNVGWAGATGHLRAVIPWLHRVSEIMLLRENVNFVSIGQPFAEGFKQAGWDNRALSVPFAAIEQYPAAMTLLDIALAPVANTKFFRGKSDLRWVEASALGIPMIASPTIYREIVHGETGFLASSPEVMVEHLLRLIDDKDLRQRVGSAAQEHVREHRTIQVLKKQWEQTFAKILA